MGTLTDRVLYSRVSAILVAIVLTLAFRAALNNAYPDHGEIVDRSAIAFAFWTILATGALSPPSGFLVSAMTMLLASVLLWVTGAVVFTYRYVAEDNFGNAYIFYVTLAISLPILMVAMLSKQLLNNTQRHKRDTLLQRAASDPIFTIVGICCSIVGVILTVFPIKIFQ